MKFDCIRLTLSYILRVVWHRFIRLLLIHSFVRSFVRSSFVLRSFIHSSLRKFHHERIWIPGSFTPRVIPAIRSEGDSSRVSPADPVTLSSEDEWMKIQADPNWFRILNLWTTGILNRITARVQKHILISSPPRALQPSACPGSGPAGVSWGQLEPIPAAWMNRQFCSIQFSPRWLKSFSINSIWVTAPPSGESLVFMWTA